MMRLIDVNEENHIAYVKLNRPEIRNAFDPRMIEELTKVFRGLNQRVGLRAVVLQGEGKVFCAGADLNWMKEMVNYTIDQNREDSKKLFAMFEAIVDCALPIVCLAQGAAFGGALGLLACCDYVIADPATQFCFSEVKLGLAPAVISAFVNRRGNASKTRYFMISGSVFNSAQATEMGLVHEVASIGDFTNRLNFVLAQFAECGPEAVRETKKLLNSLPTLSWLEQRELTTQVIAERRVSKEGQEGLKSFLEKRSPHWRSSI